MKNIHLNSIFYIFCSALTIIINKHILSNIKINLNFLFLALQSFIVALLSIICLKDKINYENAFKLIPLSFSLALMIYTGSKSIEHLPISIFTLLKNGSMVLNGLADHYFFEKKMGYLCWFSLFLMFIGSSIGEFNEYSINILGYLWIFLNVILTTIYGLLTKYHLESGYKKKEMMFLCNIYSIPQFLCCSIFIDRIDNILLFILPFNMVLICLSGVFAFLTAFTTNLCLQESSTTTLSMLGAINKLILSVFSIVFMKESNNGFLKFLSISIGFLGGILYAKKSI